MKSKGFTLIELLVVVAIVGLLSTIVITVLNTARERTRDARRLEDIKQIQIALDLYFSDYGRYPEPVPDTISCDGWDTSADGSFIVALVSGGYLPSQFKDPSSGACVGYRYFRYVAGYRNCPRAFYVLGVKNMETSSGTYSTSPGWACPNRDWQPDMEWVTGKYE